MKIEKRKERNKKRTASLAHWFSADPQPPERALLSPVSMMKKQLLYLFI